MDQMAQTLRQMMAPLEEKAEALLTKKARMQLLSSIGPMLLVLTFVEDGTRQPAALRVRARTDLPACRRSTRHARGHARCADRRPTPTPSLPQACASSCDGTSSTRT